MTQNFSKHEFDSKCGSDMPESVYHNVVKVATQLQFLRNYIGKPIKINSGYRSPEHNKRIGGVSKSQHLLGKAADIVVKGMSTVELHKAIETLISEGNMLQGGLGLYDSFVHYDIRGRKARWDYRGR
tara:strand:+ start:5638 stop:6018 length:381 start_codon:yes stop_codon:yes gene_type:complete